MTIKMTTSNDVRKKLVEMLLVSNNPQEAALLSNAIFDSLQKEISCNFIIGKDPTTGAEVKANIGTVAVYYDQTPPAPTPEVAPNRAMKRSAKHRRN